MREERSKSRELQSEKSILSKECEHSELHLKFSLEFEFNLKLKLKPEFEF